MQPDVLFELFFYIFMAPHLDSCITVHSMPIKPALFTLTGRDVSSWSVIHLTSEQ